MNSTAPPSDNSNVLRHRHLYLAIVIALVVRGLVLGISLPKLEADPDSYRLLAKNIITQQSYTLADPAEPTAFRPVLYPLLLAGTSRSGNVLPAEVAALHLMLGALTVAVVYAWVWQMGYPKYALATSLLVAVDPVLLHQSTLVMNETLATFLAALTLLAMTLCYQTLRVSKKEKQVDQESTQNKDATNDLTLKAINLGGMLILAFYCRPTFLVWGAMLLLVLCFAWSIPWKSRLVTVGTIVVISLFLLSPWVARNYLIFGKPVLATTHGGYTLLWGNNLEFYQYLAEGNSEVWDSTEFHQRIEQQYPKKPTSAREFSRDQKLAEEAITTIKQQPNMFLYSCIVRVMRFWNPLPHQLSVDESTKRAAARYLIAFWYCLQFALAGLGIWSLRKQMFHLRWAMVMLLPISFTLVHAVYWSNIRMRAPVVPVIALLAVIGLASIWNLRANCGKPTAE